MKNSAVMLLLASVSFSVPRQLKAANERARWHVAGHSDVKKTAIGMNADVSTLQEPSVDADLISHTPNFDCCPRDVVPSSQSCSFLQRPRAALLHSPEFRPVSFGVPCLAYEKVSQHDVSPSYSILINVFNSAARLRVVTTQLLKMTTGVWELIALFDACTDDSAQIMRDTLDRSADWPRCPYSTVNTSAVWQSGVNLTSYQGDMGRECWLANHDSTLTRIVLIDVPGAELRETAANNMLMLASRGQYFILLQDDQIMTQPGWNVALTVPLRTWPDVFSVSSRCAHAFPLQSTDQLRGAKCVDSAAVHPTNAEARCMFYVRDSGNRGPLAVRADYAHRLGYLDEVRFDGGGNDDHDMNTRAWEQHRWVSGHAPVDATEERCCRSGKVGGAVDRERNEWWERQQVRALFEERGRRKNRVRVPGDHDEDRRIEWADFFSACG